MIQITDKKDCCGCCACVDACSHDAITLKTDIEGFWYPEVDTTKCVDCGLCDKVCPELNITKLKKNDLEEPKCFAAINENLEVRFDSTSGGLFSALADKMYRDGGYVGGAIYNPDLSVRHFISNDKKDLPALRSSKYQQSNAIGLYYEIKNLLKNGEKVLVCGTPCQMAALRSFLRKDYENLIIVDFICRGINSFKVYRKFLDDLEAKEGSKVVSFKAKSKELGWRNLTSKITFANGSVRYYTKDINPYNRGFLATGAFTRPNCYYCQYKGFPRMADITIADFWGAEQAVGKEYDMDLGTSLVLVNSEKGETYFNSIKKKSVAVPIESIKGGNPALFKPLVQSANVDRDQFFNDIDKIGYSAAIEKYVNLNNPKPISLKEKIKNGINFIRAIKGRCGFNIPSIITTLKLNLFSRNIKTSILENKYIIATPYSVIDISKKAIVNINGIVVIGKKKVKNSKLETRLLIEDGAIFTCGQFGLSYGADVQVFKGAELIIDRECGANINATIICAERIELKRGVKIGRNVTIRDNNGGHFMSIRGYKNSKPIILGEHSWLCEGCTIMQGVKLGSGVIVGAKSVVSSGSYKANTLLHGYPAKVIDEKIYWKY